MNNKWALISSLIQTVAGLLAFVSFFIILYYGENVLRWIPTLLLAVAYIIIGAFGLIDYFKNKKL